MTARAVWAILVLVLVFLLAFGVSGMYYAAYARTVKDRAALVDSIEVLNNRAEIIRNDPLVVACSYASRADLYDGDGNRLLIVNYGVVSGRLSPMADSIETLNAKLADAEAQATERLKGWRSESRSTPMPDSTWETIFVADPVRGTLALGKDRRNIARAILVDERGRVIVSPGADSLRARRGAR